MANHPRVVGERGRNGLKNYEDNSSVENHAANANNCRDKSTQGKMYIVKGLKNKQRAVRLDNKYLE